MNSIFLNEKKNEMKNSNVPISTQEYGTAESKLTLIKIYPKLFYVIVIIVFVILN